MFFEKFLNSRVRVFSLFRILFFFLKVKLFSEIISEKPT